MARAAFERGDYGKAEQLWSRAYQTTHNRGLLYDLARCHHRLGRLALAEEEFRSFLKEAKVARPSDPLFDPLRTLGAEGELTEVEAALRAGPPSGSGLTRSAAGPQAGEVDAGREQHPVSKAVDGAMPQGTLLLVLPKDDAVDLPTASEGLEAAATEPERTGGARTPTPRRATWIAATGSVLALGAGAVFGLMARSTSSRIGDSELPRTQVDSLRSDLQGEQRKANVLLALGGGLALAAGACFVLRF